MIELLKESYYGNTVQQWLIAFLIILGTVLFGKILYWFSKNVVKKMAEKTATRVDDILIDMVEEPIVFTLGLVGIWFALNNLYLPESILRWGHNVLKVLLVMNVAWLTSRLFEAMYREYLVPLADKTETELDDQLLPILRKGVKSIIWIIAGIVALNNAGYDVGALLAGLGIGGIAFAMAAKDTISNVFGGFTIFTDHPFKINDRIRIGGFDGFVKEIGLRSTRLQTLDGTFITIPNSKFADSPVENVSMEPSRKVLLNLGLTYDTDADRMREAMQILKDIVESNDNVTDECLVSFNGFGDFSLNILFIYYIKKESDILNTISEIDLEILRRFNDWKLDFAYPTQTIHMLNG